MTDEPTTRANQANASQAANGRRSRFTWAYVWQSAMQFATAFVLYVLSAGPLYWQIYGAYHMNGSPLLARLYLPLVWLAENSHTFSNWLDWYVELWIT